jgi:hypothetical protein
MSHSLPSPHSFGILLYCRLSPSAILLVLGTCCMSTMSYAKTPSHHRACVACSMSFSSMSCSAWQSVSSLTGKPQIISANLSRVNFSAVNSRRYGLYFSSEVDVCLMAVGAGAALCSAVLSSSWWSMLSRLKLNEKVSKLETRKHK